MGLMPKIVCREMKRERLDSSGYRSAMRLLSFRIAAVSPYSHSYLKNRSNNGLAACGDNFVTVRSNKARASNY